MNGYLLAIGLMLGMCFTALMVFGILPRLDHSLKKSRGPFEACLLTRFFCLVIAMPLYVFTIWMTVVILFDGSKGISVIQEICVEDYDCSNVFALGRAQFNKGACTSADCDQEDLLARSGSQPLHFKRLGLGQDLSPTTSEAGYTCDPTELSFCNMTSFNGEEVFCAEKETVEGHTFCSVVEGISDDSDDQVRVETCQNLGCTQFTVETDSSKQFSFQSCDCTDGTNCNQYTCEVFTMPYYYPNTFYAILVTLLFVLPVSVGVYVLIKTQVRKLLNCCNKPEVYVYNQEAGMQDAYTAEDFAVGGFYEEQKEKEKFRTLKVMDFVAILGGTAIVVFFTWMSVLVSGRVGLALVSLSVTMIGVVEVYRLVKFCRDQKDDTADKVKANKQNPRKASL